MSDLKLTAYGIGKIVTAKKEHYCTMCKGIISKGERYTFFRKKYHDNKWYEYICKKCDDKPTYYKEDEYNSVKEFIKVNGVDIIIRLISNAYSDGKINTMECNRLYFLTKKSILSNSEEIYFHKKLYYKVLKNEENR
jgi:hypothetical protein